MDDDLYREQVEEGRHREFWERMQTTREIAQDVESGSPSPSSGLRTEPRAGATIAVAHVMGNTSETGWEPTVNLAAGRSQPTTEGPAPASAGTESPRTTTTDSSAGRGDSASFAVKRTRAGASTSTTITRQDLSAVCSVDSATPQSGSSDTLQITLSAPPGTFARGLAFYELLAQIALLSASKQKDYGSASDPFANVRASQDFGVAPWVGSLVRLNDKVTRLKAFATKGELANESAEDSMLDIAVYALIALLLYREEAGE